VRTFGLFKVANPRDLLLQLFIVAATALVLLSVPSSAHAKAKAATQTRPPAVSAQAAIVWDRTTGTVVYGKNTRAVMPIASITKLMTALVVLESKQSMRQIITITKADVDRIKNSGSRLPVGTRLSRENLLRLALMSSENRAASALGRNYRGGNKAFVREMNRKARELDMRDTRFVEPTGLSSRNVSSARDLVKLTRAASRHKKIRLYSTNKSYAIKAGIRAVRYTNSNRLITRKGWDLDLQKTGYISEAGRCMVMQIVIKGRRMVIVLLKSRNKYSRLADALRMRQWAESRR
jgi:D-alanyl-D-alanine endopeptidase (penicillin-binding protein 7)